MTTEEFKRQPKGPYAFYIWLWDKTVSTSLGEFSVELHMLGDGDRNPPDEEMLKRAAELVRYAETHGDHLLDILYGAYQFAGKNDFLEWSGVPEGLSREEVPSQLRKNRTLVVSRDTDLMEGDEEEGPYESSVDLVPRWDEEHALSLRLQDGQIVTANGDGFRLVDGVLRWEWEDEEEAV